jgi:Ca2+-binding RTX toxin-like protein
LERFGSGIADDNRVPRGGQDVLMGGAGDDTFIIRALQGGIAWSDFAIISGGEGTDTVVIETQGRATEMRDAFIAEIEAKGWQYLLGDDGSITLGPENRPISGAGLNFTALEVERIVFR